MKYDNKLKLYYIYENGYFFMVKQKKNAKNVIANVKNYGVYK